MAQGLKVSLSALLHLQPTPDPGREHKALSADSPSDEFDDRTLAKRGAHLDFGLRHSEP